MKTNTIRNAHFYLSAWGVLLFTIALTAGSCPQTIKLFSSNFDTAVGSPPAAAQTVGTASVHGPSGSVVVAAIPDSPGLRSVQVKRLATDTDISIFHGKFSEFKGDGVYTFSTSLYIPEGAGVASIQLGTFNQSADDIAGFLHIDFLANNRVRFDDNDSTSFGTFPRNQLFIVQVKLDTNGAAPKAHVLLSGAGASGEADREIIAPLRPKAHEFGSFKIFMGFPHVGQFYATNIVVTKNV